MDNAEPKQSNSQPTDEIDDSETVMEDFETKVSNCDEITV